MCDHSDAMMLFIGPTLLSGIGQVMKKYCDLMNGRYIQFGEEFPSNKEVFVFALPIPQWLNALPEIKKRSKKVRDEGSRNEWVSPTRSLQVLCMTVCETETVHPDYGKLFDLFDVIHTPSVFCQSVFKRQFPDKQFAVLRHVVPLMKPPEDKSFSVPSDVYIFYHIGNILDQRKNVKKIIEAFLRRDVSGSGAVRYPVLTGSFH
jgi:hypothetical protein